MVLTMLQLKKSSPNPSSCRFSPLLSLTRLRVLQVYDEFLANSVKGIRPVSRLTFYLRMSRRSTTVSGKDTPLHWAGLLLSWPYLCACISGSLFHPSDLSVWSAVTTRLSWLLELESKSSRVSPPTLLFPSVWCRLFWVFASSCRLQNGFVNI